MKGLAKCVALSSSWRFLVERARICFLVLVLLLVELWGVSVFWVFTCSMSLRLFSR